MSTDRPFIGVLFMLGFCLLAPLGDATAKWLGATVPLAILLVTRFGTQAIALVPLIWLGKRWTPLSRRHVGLLCLRAVVHICGLASMFLALRYLRLADAVAIAFVMPFIMLLLSHFVLHETVGLRRFLACGVGFIGTLMVMQPSFAEVGLPALWPLSVAVFFALFMLITRQMAKEVDPLVMQTVSGGFSTLFLLPLLLVPAEMAFETAELPWLGLLLLGLLGTIAHLMMSWSLRFAPAATLAPMQYLEIPVATLVGLVIFDELPNNLAMAGIAVTICSGLYIIYREHRAAPPAPHHPHPAAE